MYFSDREAGPRLRNLEEIPQATWGGIVVAIRIRIANGSFGNHFPLHCRDGQGVYGTDDDMLATAAQAEITEIEWPLVPGVVPRTLAILDVLEFLHRTVADPVDLGFHSFFGHSHLGFNPEAGQGSFREDINRILARGGVAFELGTDGTVRRLAPPVLREALTSAVFRTGDAALDSLLNSAVFKFLDPKPNVRQEAIEHLWDAWERLKTLGPGKDKKDQAQAILWTAADSDEFFNVLDGEARSLTDIGNAFRIRHSETTQVPLTRDEQVDYLFHRLFSLIWLLLVASGRASD